jgi:hypothetical protein
MGVFVVLVIVVIGLVLVLARMGRSQPRQTMKDQQAEPEQRPMIRSPDEDFPRETFAHSPVSGTPAGRRDKPAYPEDHDVAVTPASFWIAYRDGSAAPTQRRIEVEGFSDFDGRIYLEAWCHLRRAMRSFRADRVAEMTSVQTGEVISDVQAYVPALRRMLFDPGPDYGSVMGKAKPGLLPLIWIARADRDLSDDEMDILAEYVVVRDGLHRKRSAPADFNGLTVRKWIENARPTLDEAAGALAQMKAGGGERQLVQKFGQQLAVLDDAAAKRFRKLGLSDLDV